MTKTIVEFVMIIALFWVIMLLPEYNTFASSSRLPPMIKKNKNEVTDLFNANIEDQVEVLRQMEEAREQGLRAAENKEANSLLSEGHQIEAKADELKDLNQGEAENRGYRVQAEESELLGQVQINYNDLQVKMHKKDTDRIASASEELLARLADKLRELGVDCRQKKGEVEQEPELYLHIEQEPQKEVIYDKHLCEYLRNQYSCNDVRTVWCADAGFEAAKLTNVQGNMTHTLSHDGTLTIGVNRERYFYEEWGSQQDFIFSFNIDKAAGIDSFQLLKISWSDYVMVKLNDNIVFQAPGMNNKLEMSRDWKNARKGRDHNYFGVDIGTGDYVPANTKTYFDNSPYAEAKQHLIDGVNVLHIRIVYGKGGKIWTQFKYTERVCKNWQEKWDEKCALK